MKRAVAWFDPNVLRRKIDETAKRLWDTILNNYQRAFPR
jgi:hypothetical protein